MADIFPQIVELSVSPPPPLEANQLHILALRIESLAKDDTLLLATLNDEERKRAERFINPEHGYKFSLTRGMLRRCLGFYLNQPPQTIVFSFNEHGKPEIKSLVNNHQFFFNVSHSHEMAAFLFAYDGRVGIDIERIKPVKDLLGLAKHVCHPDEFAEFTSMDEAQREVAFYRLWTRKEAFIKANGQGLSMGLRSIYIGCGPRDHITEIKYKTRTLTDWRIKDLPCDPEYRMAIAVEAPLLFD